MDHSQAESRQLSHVRISQIRAKNTLRVLEPEDLATGSDVRFLARDEQLSWADVPTLQTSSQPIRDVSASRHMSSVAPGSPSPHSGRSAQKLSKNIDHIALAESEREPVRSAAKDLEDEVIETPFGFLRRHAAELFSQTLSWEVKRVAQKNRCFDYQTQFLPRSKIRKLTGKRAVLLETSRHISPVKLVEEPDKYRTILAILHLMKSPSSIKAFIEAGVCDMHLPFDEITIPNDGGSRNGLQSRKSQEIQFAPFERRGDVQAFVQEQWTALAHVFEGAHEDHIPCDQLEPETILPFKEYSPTGREGAYGSIFRAHIHPDHHPWDWNKRKNNKNKDTCNVFAVKVLQRRDAVEFAQEVTVLRKLIKASHTHKHLINLLAAYEKCEIYHLVFPWAEYDLLEYWKQVTPDQNSRKVAWLARQCQGLAEALNMIHHYKTFSGGLLKYGFNDLGKRVEEPSKSTSIKRLPERGLFGRHGDLKPENILWFPESNAAGSYGILKIADFGSAEFTAEEIKHGKVPNSPTYQSPEYGLCMEHSIACDIWALGCIYLEFTTWYFGGWESIERFAKERLQSDRTLSDIRSDKFFSIAEEGSTRTASVKVAVTSQIESLRSLLRTLRDPLVIDFFKTLLHLIKYDMLVINQVSSSRQNAPYKAARGTTRNTEGLASLEEDIIGELQHESSRLLVPDTVYMASLEPDNQKYINYDYRDEGKDKATTESQAWVCPSVQTIQTGAYEGALSVSESTEHDPGFQQLWSLFRLDARSDLGLAGADMEQLRQLYNSGEGGQPMNADHNLHRIFLFRR